MVYSVEGPRGGLGAGRRGRESEEVSPRPPSCNASVLLSILCIYLKRGEGENSAHKLTEFQS